MKPTDLFHKTAKGLAEVERRSEGLAKPLRRVLIVVDGRRDVEELSVFARAGELDGILDALWKQGYIEPVGGSIPDPDRPKRVPEADDQAVFTLIKHHAMAEISNRIGPLGKLLIAEIDGCKTPLELRQKLRNLENALVHVLGREEGINLARRIGTSLTRLAPTD